MASALVCARCGHKIIGNGSRHLGKLYCNACYDQIIAELNELEKAKEHLFQYIKKLFGEVDLPSDIISIIEYNLKNGKKPRGIEGTIYYYFEVLGHEPNNIYLLGKVIRDEYEHARTYMEERKRIMEANKDVEIDVPPVIYKIERPKGKRKIKYRMEDL